MVFLARKPLVRSMALLSVLLLTESLLFWSSLRLAHPSDYEPGTLTMGMVALFASLALVGVLGHLRWAEMTQREKRMLSVPVSALLLVNGVYLMSQLVILMTQSGPGAQLIESLDALYKIWLYSERVLQIYQLPLLSVLWIIANVATYSALSSKALPITLSSSVNISRDQVRALLMKYNETPSNYLILEAGVSYYASTAFEGVIGYTLCKRTAFVIAEPVCPKAHLEALLEEFKTACDQAGYRICFSKVTESCLPALEASGFAIQAYGQEALLSAERFTLNGTAAAKIRWGINKTTKLGYHVREYTPMVHRDQITEERIKAICEEWFDRKNNIELNFMLGQLCMDDPMDRRYFVIENGEGEIEAFITCMPYAGSQGYYVDVMRKCHKAPLGTMEKLIADSFTLLKNEGIQEMSLGLAPLVHLKAGPGLQSRLLTVLFQAIFERVQGVYGFKPLYQFKKKFNPDWSPRYIAFYPPRFTLSLGFTLIQIKYKESLWHVAWKTLMTRTLSRQKPLCPTQDQTT